jgi:hypothetical protein
MVERLSSAIFAVVARPNVLTWANEKSNEHLIKRLDPPRQAQVLMVLLGLLLLGGLLIAMIVLGGRRARRIARLKPTAPRNVEEPWYQKPLAPPPSDPRSHEPE